MFFFFFPTKSLLNANTLELHYWLNDDSHTMDAYVHNECESEFLSLVKEVAATFNLQITVETEALAEGGVRRWFKVISKSENSKAVITTALVTALIGSIITTPITSSISEVTKHVIDSFFEDPELKELEKEKLKLEIQNLKVEVEYKKQKLNTSKKVLKRKSNFFEKIDKYPKIQQVSVIVENVARLAIDKEILVKREDFHNYILASDELDTEPIDNAVIEIISPVLKKGVYKWRGIYNGDIISFEMKSNEFKTLVQTGKIEFKNGSSIKCLLNVSKKLDVNGDVQITGYEILRVNEYFENNQPIETPEFKKHKQNLEAEKMQTKLTDLAEF